MLFNISFAKARLCKMTLRNTHAEDHMSWHRSRGYAVVAVMRLQILRSILAILLSVGLSLAPMQVASTMPMTSTAHLGNVVSKAPSSMDHPCPCCDFANKCQMVGCTAHCAQVAPALVATLVVPPGGHVPLGGFMSLMHDGLIWQPPTPPPRS